MISAVESDTVRVVTDQSGVRHNLRNRGETEPDDDDDCDPADFEEIEPVKGAKFTEAQIAELLP